MSYFVDKTHNQKDDDFLQKEHEYALGWADDTSKYAFKAPKGLNAGLIRQISKLKKEPKWMLDIRLRAFVQFLKMPMPNWGADLSKINFDEIIYYLKPTKKSSRDWQDVPDKIKQTFDKLGIPKAERNILAGVKSQYDSEVIYGSLQKYLIKQGVVFLGMDEGLRQYPELVHKYFGSVISMQDNKFAALNTAVWSGGSFIYVPKGVKVDKPLQAYFRINAAAAGQFERTLIIMEPDSYLHYIEGCSAPIYTEGSLHSAVVEIVVGENSHCQYSTIQNWYTNVFNLVTKRAVVAKNAAMYWIDGNIGSKTTMKYPACVLKGENAHGEVLSVAFAGAKQELDTGAKMIHLAKNTSSRITSKSVSKDGGLATYRGLVYVAPGADNCKSKVVCDALILDPQSRSDTYPSNKIMNRNVSLEHEATVSKIGERQLFYLMSRGLSEEEASTLIVSGFLGDIVKELPLEYAVEFNRLVSLEMEGSVG